MRTKICAAHAVEPEAIVAPLSLRLAEARLQLHAVLAVDLRNAPVAVHATLRGLELFLLDASLEALQLEGDAALALARCQPRARLPRWLRFAGGRI